MTEIVIGGVYLHPLLVAALLAFPAAGAAEWLLARVGAYRFVWHRGLFDVALTIILWGAIAALLAGETFKHGIFG